MRIPFIAGNWKMFKTKAEAIAFAEEFRELYKDTDVQTAICAPFTNLEALKEAFAGTEIKVGAQMKVLLPEKSLFPCWKRSAWISAS